ncbi:MAG TPA: polymer-forming cytoskeletal protein [Polyangiaceae bacterium]|nr:polymer-forming cytoskeletal protein [Polyangiaceae bacterium]
MAYASVIGSSSVIRGNVRGETSLEILGRVEGDVGISGDLSLGPDAVVVGTISGARIVIGGSVQGDVTASEAIVITETGRVVGDLTAPRIGMSEGALVRGSVRSEGGAASGRSSSPRSAEVRAPAPPPVERAAPRAANHAAPVANHASAAKAPAKKAPPPPVIQAPRAGARARKRMLKR